MDSPSSDGPPLPNLNEQLPPVRPPSPGFLMQLFVVPMFIVMIIVAACVLFNWMANRATDPKELVDSLKSGNVGSWQKALDMANMLCDRHETELRQSPELAQAVADLLETEIQDGSFRDDDLKRRIYLCVALGVFETPDGIPTLVKAAETERDFGEVEVRKTAIEALARRFDNGSLTVDAAGDGSDVQRVLLAAAKERDEDADKEIKRSQLRYTAAYALGVVGGKEAEDQLAFLLSDPVPAVRYNAATGLARVGDARAVNRLLEMLDPQNPAANSDGKQLDPGTLGSFIRTGLRATSMYLKAGATEGASDLVAAVNALDKADVPIEIKNVYAPELKATLSEFAANKVGQ